ncbi:hypothetical protein [Synechococcus sp. A15-60]|uniref:hypothetical protein n=1 Tax=Synechococcus sp. A15-60 TaxID=1050655 RepID=UPI001644D062|nr:hypothetical protein [Synechococcus sp. A15-60]
MALQIQDSSKALKRDALRSWMKAWGSRAMALGLVGPMALPTAANQQETRKALVGLAAYAECKVLHDGYSRARAEAIIQAGIENNGWQQDASWLQSPQGIRVVTLTSKAMNTSCNNFDQSSPQFIPAIEAINAL